MRLPELKNLIKPTINGENKIELNHKSIYNNQRYLISNFNNLYNSLNALKNQSWIKSDTAIIDDLNKKYDTTLSETDIDPQDFQRLQKLIEELNQQLPIFIGVINSFVHEQTEEAINIKIPQTDDINLSDLSNFNASIDALFSTFLNDGSINGKATFAGFSGDGEWLSINIMGSKLAHAYTCSVLNIANTLQKSKQEWLESEETQLNVMIIKKKTTKESSITKADINSYVQEKLSIKTIQEVKKLIKAFQFSTATSADLSKKTVQSINKALELLERGGEFQPSSQKASYLVDENSFEVDFKELQRNL